MCFTLRPYLNPRAHSTLNMRVAAADPSGFLFNVTLLVFTMTLVLSIHSDTFVLSKPPSAPSANEKDSHPLYDASDLSEYILHNLAYLISCFSVTVFLLICTAIILGLATLSMELMVEAFNSVRRIRREGRARRERALQLLETETDTEPLDDIYCDTWNYR